MCVHLHITHLCISYQVYNILCLLFKKNYLIHCFFCIYAVQYRLILNRYNYEIMSAIFVFYPDCVVFETLSGKQSFVYIRKRKSFIFIFPEFIAHTFSGYIMQHYF